MSREHVVCYNEFQGIVIKHQLCSSHGGDYKRVIAVIEINGKDEAKVHYKLEWNENGKDKSRKYQKLKSAINKYNSIY